MSAIRQPTSTARTLGDAVPTILPRFGEKRPAASEGKKVGEIQAEHQVWLDGQETTTRCTECPDWSHTGPASEARTVAAKHRALLHSEQEMAEHLAELEELRKEFVEAPNQVRDGLSQCPACGHRSLEETDGQWAPCACTDEQIVAAAAECPHCGEQECFATCIGFEPAALVDEPEHATA